MNKYIAALVLAIMCAFFVIGEAQEKLLPGEANAKITREMNAEYQKYQKQLMENPDLKFDYGKAWQALARKYLATVQTTDLDEKENLEYARLLYSAGKKEEAMTLYTQLDTGNTTVAYRASIARMEYFRGEGRYAEVEKMMEEHQRRFKPTPDTSEMLYYVLDAVLRHYFAAGNHEKVVDLVLSEVDRVPEQLDAAYLAPMLLDGFADSFIAGGKNDELFALMENFTTKYEKAFEARKGEIPEGDSEEAHMAQSKILMYNTVARRLRAKTAHARLLGEPAPDFNFTHFFNTEPTTLADLKGKVVVVDFWANWCKPCKKSFPSMRKLYDEYKDKGFVILGVTGLQGNFNDGGITKASVTPEEELELTQELLKRHNMNWPIAFSDRGPYDPEYGVGGIPTFAVIDKKGLIRFVGVGASSANEAKLKEIVPMLLAEED